MIVVVVDPAMGFGKNVAQRFERATGFWEDFFRDTGRSPVEASATLPQLNSAHRPASR
jgi:hypothetical protein